MEAASGATRFARSGSYHIAYRVLGSGPFDLIYSPGWVSHLELALEDPLLGRFLRRLASFSRLVLFDKRARGSRTASIPTSCRRWKSGWTTCEP